MEKVNGIGGIFFRARKPEKLAQWYEQHLGVNPVPTEDSHPPWIQEEGPTAFAPFENTTTYFGDPAQSWMVNFRVNDLCKMVDQLRGAGVEVTIDTQAYPNGKFARLYDPEGNPIELWEPKN
ncbi:VOC family protein [Microbulbifer spongiae]|uniref:VOC family protein n=1 Tax=Microbulbifer spongiae TaxID=2944933 RepID=A0ABY9EF20_9GAMM|nr:VOC family protein [Microbulbifer sp. MI-G]WKD51252.1 VOC family protein [Microbulbifer sp. MI-G]